MEDEGGEKRLVLQSVRFKAKRMIHKSRPKKVYFMIIALFLVAGGSVAYILMSTQGGGTGQPSTILGNSVSSLIGGGELSDEDVINRVAKLTYVPAGETPEVATIADVNQLNSQVFFANAANGDKVLIYRDAKRVILYRPGDNKIMETGPLVEPSPIPEVEEVIEVEVTPIPASPSPTIITSPTPSPTLAPIEN